MTTGPGPPPHDPRGSFNLVPGELYDADQWRPDRPHNIILADPPPGWRWLFTASEQLAEWRGLLRSTYLQWCLVINGLYLADSTYRAPDWQQPDRRFTVEGIRAQAGQPVPVRLAAWDGPTAADHHLATVPKTVAWGLVDLYSTFEDFVFAMYRAHFDQHPGTLLRTRGSDGARQSAETIARLADCRRHWEAAQAGDPAALERWRNDLAELFAQWRGRHARRPLPALLRGFFAATQLPVPTGYRSGPEQWVRPLEYVHALRNALVHGDKTVGPKLAAAAVRARIDLAVGEPIVIDVIHLQAFEQYVDQVLTAINLAMAEAILGPLTEDGAG